MTRRSKTKSKENPYNRIFDDAGRALESWSFLDEIEDYDFLDDLPKMPNRDEIRIPFPYEPLQPRKYGWK